MERCISFLKKHDYINDRKPTNQLYWLPLCLGLLGGVLMYFIAKKDDKKMAVRGLIYGTMQTIVILTIFRNVLF